MPLQVRPIAVYTAVIFFFGISVICWLSGLSPFTCCKRAMTGAALGYMATALAVKAINAVLVSAIISDQINQKGESGSAGRD